MSVFGSGASEVGAGDIKGPEEDQEPRVKGNGHICLAGWGGHGEEKRPIHVGCEGDQRLWVTGAGLTCVQTSVIPTRPCSRVLSGVSLETSTCSFPLPLRSNMQF